jgi:predicted Zn-ribbon and HTH transcriptional regulator
MAPAASGGGHLMDIENLIEQLSARGLRNGSSLGYHSGLFDEAVTALPTLQAENKRLKSLLGESGQDLWSKENQRADRLEAENEKLRDELEQVKRERHGRWFFKYPNGWACSRCGEWGLMIDNRGICKSSYCPNCGALMKEDEHETG